MVTSERRLGVSLDRVHLCATTALASLILIAVSSSASAVISDVHPIDGPGADVLAVGGAAMSEDGSGGVVYLKRAGGRAHVFAAQFRDGRFRPAQRVDVDQGFDSSWPRIGAGDGGRLVVTWVQELGADSDRMFSAALDPGAAGFQRPVPVDFNVGEATATYPSLAMARGGQTYLTYRVVTDTSSANPPGYVGADVRVARYSGQLWSRLGAVADRNPSSPVRVPTEANSPKVGIDIQGQGVVAFQEPGDDFVDRVWARRLFGPSMGIPLTVSPDAFGGAPLLGPADAFSLDVSGFGQGAVAFRQQPGQGGRLGGERIFVNEIADIFTDGAGRFGGARPIDGSPREAPGPPSVAVTPKATFLSGFGSSTASLLAAGDDEGTRPLERLDGGGSSVAGDPLVDLSETGAAVAAWKQLRAGVGSVLVQERRADGVPETASVSAPRGGIVNGLRLGGSGRGDAIVAFQQGGPSFGQLAAVVIDAPPSDFFILLPDGWQRRRRIPISWDPSLNAVSRVSYTVSVDDEPVKEGVRGRSAGLRPSQVANGVHRIQIFAVDGAGQETGSQAGRLKVDRLGPRARIRVRGRSVSVRITDGARRRTSGVRRSSTRISFGDGQGRASVLRAGHVYGRAGRYRIVVRARDRARNRALIRRWVRVR